MLKRINIAEWQLKKSNERKKTETKLSSFWKYLNFRIYKKLTDGFKALLISKTICFDCFWWIWSNLQKQDQHVKLLVRWVIW